jgi:hypothetical protein
MEFRWIAIIALWTMFAGPVFHATTDTSRAQRAPVEAAATKTVTQR